MNFNCCSIFKSLLYLGTSKLLIEQKRCKMKKYLLFVTLFLVTLSLSKSDEPRLILVEQITTSSANSPELLPIAQQFNQIVNSNSEVIPFTIHTNENIDQFYKDRPDLSTRILMYKKKGEKAPLPSFYVNGSEVVGISGLQSKINTQKGKTSPLKMKVQIGDVNPNFMFVEVKMDIDTTLTPEDQMYCAIIERHINNPSAGNPSEPDFYYVTRKIDLQPTGGDKITKNDLGFSGNRFDFNVEKFWNMDEIYAIAWVQNSVSKEVLQVEKVKIYNEKPEIATNKDTVKIDDSNKTEPQFIEIYNPTMGYLDISDISIDNNTDFTINHNESEKRIYPGMTKIINLDLNTLKVGEYSANLTIKSNATGKPTLVIPITAKVENSDNPIITADINTIDFGDVSKQKTEIVSLTNTGKGDLKITSIDFAANDEGNFSILNDSIPVLGENETLFLKVNFKPKEEKAYFSTLQIHSNATNESTLSISLKGQGKNLELYSSIIVSTNEINFGKTNFTTPIHKSVVIENTGNIPLEVKNSAFENDDDGVFSFVGEKNITVAAESKDSLVVEFVPKDNITYNAKLIIRSNNTDPAKRRIEVPLIGIGEGVTSVENFVDGFEASYYAHNLNLSIQNKDLHNLLIEFYNLSGIRLKEVKTTAGSGNMKIETNELGNNQIIIFKITADSKVISTGKFINN